MQQSKGSKRRVLLREAADELGITVDAARQRFKRGLLEGEKDEDGRIFVWLDVNPLSAGGSTQALLEAKDEIIETLRRELEDWKEEARRKDHLLAAALERIPAIEAPEEEPPQPRESTVSASEDPTKGDVPQDQADSEMKRPWWQRWFGGSGG